MIDKLEKAIVEAEKASGKCDDRRFYDGYITGLKYAIIVIRENNRNKALNPFTVEESSDSGVIEVDDVLVFNFDFEDNYVFYEYTTVYYDRNSRNLLVVRDGFNEKFESELNENMIQLTEIGGKKLQVLVPDELPFSDETEVE